MGRVQEVNKHYKYLQAWETSKKHSSYMVDALSKCTDHYELINIHYKQYLSELHSKGILTEKNKVYIQVWETALNTAKRQNVNNKRASIKLLHQTSVMRSNN